MAEPRTSSQKVWLLILNCWSLLHGEKSCSAFAKILLHLLYIRETNNHSSCFSIFVSISLWISQTFYCSPFLFVYLRFFIDAYLYLNLFLSITLFFISLFLSQFVSIYSYLSQYVPICLSQFVLISFSLSVYLNLFLSAYCCLCLSQFLRA